MGGHPRLIFFSMVSFRAPRVRRTGEVAAVVVLLAQVVTALMVVISGTCCCTLPPAGASGV